METEEIIERLRANAQKAVDCLGHLGVTLDSVLEHQAANEIERLIELLDNRDRFIVDRDLWQDFVDALPNPQQKS
jgi:FtsZ-binding cell division protein ZapB